jgi:predicted dehydrogenase
MNNILHWGLLSTARINRSIIPALRVSKRNRLVAVASRSKDNAESYAREWQIPKAHGSYEALLDDPEIDVIYNPLPNHLHVEWTVKAVQAGKHVLCEKPMGLSVAEIDTIISAARSYRRVVTEAFMYRHHPQTLRVKEMVEAGALGQVKIITGAFTYTLTHEGDYRLDPAMGGGSLWDIGCYPVSYARLIAGADPMEVFAWQVTGKTGIDETFVGQMRFPGGVYAHFYSSFAIPLHVSMELIGTEATLRVPMPFKPGLKEQVFLRRENQTETIEIEGQELYTGEVEDLADAILEGKPPRISLSDSRGNTATLVALLESARTSKPSTL